MTAILFLLRAIILVLLWAFVLAAIVSVRQDIFGTRKAARRPATPRPTPAPAPRPAAAAAPAGRRDRGAPRKLVVTGGAPPRPNRPPPGQANPNRPRRHPTPGPP